MSGNFITKEIWIKASVQEVFDSFTNAEAMLKWHGKEVETNPVVGGIYRVVFENGDTIIGEFKEVVPGKKVVYSARYMEVDSVVTISFTEEDGGTRVELYQEFAPDQDISSFKEGWGYFLGLLKEYWEGGPSN